MATREHGRDVHYEACHGLTCPCYRQGLEDAPDPRIAAAQSWIRNWLRGSGESQTTTRTEV